MHTGYLSTEILRVRAFPMEMRIHLTKEIRHFAIFMTLILRKRDSYLFLSLAFKDGNT